MIDWENVQKEAGGAYLPFYADGKYTAKCDDIEIKEVGDKGSVIMKFHFEGDEKGQYPTADHWLSFKNDSWRIWHNKNLMVVLGATEENARKAVEVCESKESKENKIKAYEQTYKKLVAKKPTVDIEIFTENKYARAEFLDRSVAMPHGSEAQPAADDTVASDILEQGDEVTDLSDIPF